MHPTPTVEDAAERLVARCVAGEPAAWRVLHRQYYATTLHVLKRLGVPSHQLEDASQEVFLDVFRYLPRFRGEADVKTWVYRICVSHARTLRRRARLTALLASVLTPLAERIAQSPIEESLATRQLSRALERLTEAQRPVFVLFELQGLSGQEIAAIIERPEATVFRRLHDARARFVQAVEENAL